MPYTSLDTILNWDIVQNRNTVQHRNTFELHNTGTLYNPGLGWGGLIERSIHNENNHNLCIQPPCVYPTLSRRHCFVARMCPSGTPETLRGRMLVFPGQTLESTRRLPSARSCHPPRRVASQLLIAESRSRPKSGQELPRVRPLGASSASRTNLFPSTP